VTYRALIVEDNQDVVAMVEDILRSLGHEFDTATCRQEARELMDGHQHDYYLLDLEILVETDRGLARMGLPAHLLCTVDSGLTSVGPLATLLVCS
jgi:CheY-like chemotaxis protein